MKSRARFACVTGCVLSVGTTGALYIELSNCFINKNKLYTRISGTSAEEPGKKRTCVKRQLDSGYPEREKTGSIILI